MRVLATVETVFRVYVSGPVLFGDYRGFREIEPQRLKKVARIGGFRDNPSPQTALFDSLSRLDTSKQEDLAHAFSYAIPSESAGGFTVIRRGTKSQISNSILMVSLTPTETSSVDECLAFYRSDEAIQGLRLGAMMKWGSL